MLGNAAAPGNHDAFSYQNINNGETVMQGEFISTPPSSQSGFIGFGIAPLTVKAEDGVAPEALDQRGAAMGWKFHISISDLIGEDGGQQNLADGWEIVKNILIEERVFFSKIIRQNRKMEDVILPDSDEPGAQRGKQITVYISHQPGRLTAYWRALINRITHELAQAGIRPSYRPPNDIPVPGSNYITYRCDLIESELLPLRDDWLQPVEADNGPGRAAEKLAEYREQFIMDQPVDHQPEIPEWQAPESGCGPCNVI